MTNGTIVGDTGTIGTAMLRTDYIDVAYIDEDNEAVEVSG
jgi:hypothetical protein